jgi:hypothetical protein
MAKTQTVDLGKKGSFSVKKGALHSDLGVSQDKKLTNSDIQKGLNSANPKTRRRAASAKGFRAMSKAKRK